MKKQLTFSYSAIKDFDSCPRKYHATRILKIAKQGDTEATLYGTAVHSALEHFLMHGTPLPPEFERFLPYAVSVSKASGTLLCEEKLGMRADFSPCGFFDDGVWFRGVPDVLVVGTRVARVGDWKGLDVDTKIPTPTGLVRMKDLQVGDLVFGTDGVPYPITDKSEVKHLPCYEVAFTHGAAVVCDHEHLWEIQNVGTTPVTAVKPRMRVQLPAPVEYAPAVLPIDPYVFGLWLADGSSRGGVITNPDAFVWEEIEHRGYALGAQTEHREGACRTHTVLGLRAQLRAAGMLGNKHIPAVYMRASVEQRLDLLRGLMDGDGYANATRGQGHFSTTDKGLSTAVVELVASLGMRASQADVPYKGFGVTGRAYPVNFRPRVLNCFLLPRKAEVASAFASSKANYLEVKHVTEVPSRPTQCISVGSPNAMYLCTDRYIPTHNTGKSARYADPDQLELMAAMVMVHYPHIEEVRGVLVFLVAKDVVHKVYTRAQLPEILSKWAGKAARIEAAVESGVWNPRKGPLCRFCPVSHLDCEFKE